MLSVPKGQKVLDIGGGDGPFARADVQCEKFIGDDIERTNQFKHDRPLVLGDIECLPFKDQSFDFIFCSHILEHTQDPTQAIKEITRVGKGGYIEVPSEYMEIACRSTPSHYWTINRESTDVLVFTQKIKASPNPEVDRVYKQQLWGIDRSYEAFHWKNFYTLFNIALYWKKEIPHKVIWAKNEDIQNDFSKGSLDSLERISNVLNSAKKNSGTPTIRKRIKYAIQKFFTDPKTRSWLAGQLACPQCKGALAAGVDLLKCEQCQVDYPVVSGIPILLKEYGKSKVLNP